MKEILRREDFPIDKTKLQGVKWMKEVESFMCFILKRRDHLERRRSKL